MTTFLEERALWKGGDFVWCKQDGFSKSSRYLLFYSSFSSNHPGAKSLVRHGIESILFPNKPLPLLLWDSYSMVLYLDFPNSTAWRYRWAAGWAGSARASRWVSSPPPPPPRTLCLRIIVGCLYLQILWEATLEKANHVPHFFKENIKIFTWSIRGK